VRTGVIFAIAEDEQGAASLLASEFLGHRVVDGIVEGSAQVTVLFRADLRKTVRLLFILFQMLEHVRARLREIVDQAQVIAKTEQEGVIPGPENLLQKDLQISFVPPAEVFLAVAGIDDKAEGEGHVLAAGKEGNLLQDSVLENLYIVLGEVVDQRATRPGRRSRR
jgi:hypothetical protein